MLPGKNPRVRFISILILAMVLMLYSFSPALAVSDSDIRTKADRLLSYYNQQAACDDWEALGLRWLGTEIAPKRSTGDTQTASDYARNLLGQIAAGATAAAINADISTLQGMQEADGDFNTPGAASLNQTIWPVIALDCAASNGFVVNYDQAKAAAYIAARQDASGGFDESGWGVDVDSTAHVMIALAPYKNDNSGVIDNCLAYLKSQQAASGGFQSWGNVSPDSTAAVIEALVALGYAPQHPPGVGWQGNMVEALLSFQLPSGAFNAPWALGQVNAMVTRNALLALGDLVQLKSKYQNGMPVTSGLAITVNKNGTPRLDGDASITVKMDNASSNSIGFLLIAALYDTSLEKMNVYSSIAQSITGNSQLETDYGLSLPASGSYEVRVYAWDNWTSRTPLASPTIIPLQ